MSTSVAGAAPTAAGDAASSSSVVVRYLGPDRGHAMFVTKRVEAGEVLFTEHPAALFQPNRPLVQTCSNVRCMRVLGPLSAQIECAHAFYAQASGGSVASALAPGPASDPAARLERTQQLERLLSPPLPLPSAQVACRGRGSDNAACNHLYCSEACEARGWDLGGHALLCPGLHAPMAHFLNEVNVARNPDLQVAAQILAAFISEVARARHSDQDVTAPAPPAADGADAAAATAAGLDEAAVRTMWQRHTSYHAVPWSAVLAVQTVTQQQGQQGGALSLRIVEEHVRRLREQDERDAVAAAAAARDGAAVAVTTIGVAPPVVEPAPSSSSSSSSSSAATSTSVPPASSSSWSAAEQSLLSSLSSAQQQYRAALARPFLSLRSGLESSPARGVAASRPLWGRYASLPAFDLLAGANRLNCTQTQTALPLPVLDEGTLTSSTSSNSSPSALLLRSLETLFAPMALPLASARALLPLHSKMNHSCLPSARVENWADASAGPDAPAGAIGASAQSVARAQRRAEEAAEKRREMAEASRAAHNSSAPSSSSANANKKKKQKARKAAAAGEAVEAQRALVAWEEEGAALDAIAQRRASASTAPAAPSSASASAAASVASAAVAPAPSASVGPVRASTCEIVVRATRALQPGEEVLINYLPPAASGAPTAVRRQYLQTHYLFHCDCVRCNPTAASTGAIAIKSS